MTPSRWRAMAAGAILVLALAWGLWPSSKGGAGFAGSALREAVVQSGAPGSTPGLASPASAEDGFVEARVFAQGKPRSGAHVRLYLRGRAGPDTGPIDWRFAGAADSGPSGIARIPARPGGYLLAARSETFAPARLEFQRPAGERATQVSVELQPAITISGRTVQKETQEAVPLALVTLVHETSLRPAAPAEEQARTTADARGHFRLDGLAPGRYRATAQAPGFGSVEARLDASASKEVTLELTTPAFIEGRVVAADGTATLAGTVVAAGRQQPVAGAEVAVSPHQANGDSGRAVSDARGAFRVAGLPPGSYDLVVSADGFARASRRGVAVQAGQQFPLRVELRRTGALEGVVRDTSGRSIAWARVRARISEWGAPEARSDESGAYRLASLAPGPGLFSAQRDGSAQGATATADVPEGGTAKLDFQLENEGVLTGRVRRKDGSPPPGDAAVLALATNAKLSLREEPDDLPVDANGVYLASLPAGAYRLFVRGAAAGAQVPTAVTVEAGKTTIQDLTWVDAVPGVTIPRAP